MYDITVGSPSATPMLIRRLGDARADTGSVYSDNSGYSACLTDAQIQTELGSVLSADGLTSDLNHLYLVFLPKGVESCFGTENDSQGGECTISAEGGHSAATTVCSVRPSSPTVYADLPYAIEDSPTSG